MRKTLLAPAVWIGALAVACLLIALAGSALLFRPPAGGTVTPVTLPVTLLPAPTSTPRPTATPTLDPLAQLTATAAPGQIAVGRYVQISGTEGAGLRLRAAPGLDGTPLFLGFDTEVFEVRDGPQVADGYTWWFIVSPYDENRSGWAAADYLEVINP
jgi:hypothetical protein